MAEPAGALILPALVLSTTKPLALPKAAIGAHLNQAEWVGAR